MRHQGSACDASPRFPGVGSLMYQGKSVVAIIPARGGSKGIPKKNLCTINGKSLVRLAVECARLVPDIDTIYCSTDCERIAVEAHKAGARVIERPPALAGDDVGDAEVLLHADGSHDIVLMLQPTAPQRTPGDVRLTLYELVDGGYDSVWTVSPIDLHFHPLKQLVLGRGMYDPRGYEITCRQQLQPTYYRNGICYAMTRECLQEHGTMGEKWGAVILDGDFISIDTIADLDRLNGRLP